MTTRANLTPVNPPVETPVNPPVENPPVESVVTQPASPPVATRFIVVSARIPLPLDQWEAASVMHGFTATIKAIESLMSEATGDPAFKLDTQVVNSVSATVRPVSEGGKKRGRKSNAERAAADALAAEMAARTAAQTEPEGGSPEGDKPAE